MIKKIINCFFLLVLLTNNAFAETTISDLVNEGRLRLTTELSKEKDVAVGEQVILKVHISTDRWFAGGTIIDAPRVKDAVSLKQNKLSTNYAYKENGKTWSSQTWEITIFPQKTGDFFVPSMPIEVSVSASNQERKVTGLILTEPVKFSAILPSGFITEDTKWFSGEDFKLKETLTMPEEEVEVGDAIIRELDFSAKNTVSMLFPKIDTNEVKGVKTYLSQNENKDSAVRGDYFASRKQKITYIVQESGDIALPEIKINWWDIKNQEWKEEVLPSVSFFSNHTPKSWIKYYAKELTTVFIGIILLIFFRKRIRSLIVYLWNLETMRFYRSLIKKDLKNLNKLNYLKLKEKQDSLVFKNKVDKNLLNKWESHYSIKDTNVSRSAILKIRRDIKKNES